MLSKGFTVWLTGMPSAGKSTIANALAKELLRRGRLVEVLDGDVVRLHLSQGLGYSREHRDINIKRIGFVAKLLTRNGVATVVAAVSPYRATRDEVREDVGEFVEVFVDAPAEVCQERDVKGLYAKTKSGQMQGMTGVDDPYEPPANPEVVVKTAEESLEQSVAKIVQTLEMLQYLEPRPESYNAEEDAEIQKRLEDLGYL